MAKIKYNIKLWVDKATNLATDTTVYKENDFIFATDTGVLKKGDGVKTYANLGSIGTVATWANIADKPSTFAPSAHDHAVVEDEESGLEAADTIQDLAEALSARILEHDHAVVEDEESGLEAADTIQDLAEALSARILEHDHAVVEDEESGLEAADTIQELAEALSARIADLDDRVTLLEEEVFEE